MMPFFVLSLVAACFLALVAYLQSEASWWKGPLASLALFVLGVCLVVFLPEEKLDGSFLPPVWYFSLAAWFGALLIGAGALTALALRRYVPTSKIVKMVFGGGWGLMFIGLLLLAT